MVELLIVVAIILLLVSVATIDAGKARQNAVEAVVAREVQTIHQAQVQYMSQFGEYAGSLAQLGPPASGPGGPRAAGLIPASLASGEKNGYLFVMARTAGGYIVNAAPKSYPSGGRRTFYLDENGTIHHNWGPEPATAQSPEFK